MKSYLHLRLLSCSKMAGRRGVVRDMVHPVIIIAFAYTPSVGNTNHVAVQIIVKAR